MTRSIRTLLADLIDYAGLFPPAKLSMAAAVEAFNRALMGEHEWMLGRFICPASRLDEFEREAAVLLPGTQGTSGYRERAAAIEPWRVSVLIDTPLESSLAAIAAFNERHDDPARGLAHADMIEIKVARPGEIDPIIDRLPEDLFPFFEFPGGEADCRGFVTALAGSPAGAKIRTGGVVAGAFPTPGEVGEFLRACADADVPFKATAGLHHPVRSSHPMTYEPGAPSCTMHGFLNVFLGAAMLRAKPIDQADLLAILKDEEPDDFRFAEEVVAWREHSVDVAALAHVREGFAHSFGSCSFDEPVADLTRLGLL